MIFPKEFLTNLSEFFTYGRLTQESLVQLIRDYDEESADFIEFTVKRLNLQGPIAEVLNEYPDIDILNHYLEGDTYHIVFGDISLSDIQVDDLRDLLSEVKSKLADLDVSNLEYVLDLSGGELF